MSRWKPDARSRLAQAALTLYDERGFEQTTVAEIAQRAGLTERTFFRHFADKREVLFGGSQELESLLVAGVAGAPSDVTPLTASVRGFETVAEGMFPGERRDYARRRAAVIAANPGLLEREMSKYAAMTETLFAALRQRGVDDGVGRVAAEAGVVIFRVAFERWVSDTDGADLTAWIRRSRDQLVAVTTRG